MIQAGNLYVVSWTVTDYFIRRPDPEEYLRYLDHGVRLARWLSRRRPETAEAIARHRV